MTAWMDRRRITRIGPCSLSEDPRGYWIKVPCEVFIAVRDGVPKSDLCVSSSFTNLEHSYLGGPFIFTEWCRKSDDLLLCATGGRPDERRIDGRCGFTHAVFVVTEEEPT